MVLLRVSCGVVRVTAQLRAGLPPPTAALPSSAAERGVPGAQQPPHPGAGGHTETRTQTPEPLPGLQWSSPHFGPRVSVLPALREDCLKPARGPTQGEQMHGLNTPAPRDACKCRSGSGLPETPSPQLSQDLFVFLLLQFLTVIRCYPFSRELLAGSPNSLAYLVPSCLGNTW